MSSRSSGGKTIPSLYTPTPIPKHSAGRKEGFTYRHCITSMPKIDFGPTTPQFNSAQQHFYLLLKVYAAKAAWIIHLIQPMVWPLLILLYPLILSLSHTHRQPFVAEAMGKCNHNITRFDKRRHSISKSHTCEV